jgi:hypothetical protein
MKGDPGFLKSTKEMQLLHLQDYRHKEQDLDTSVRSHPYCISIPIEKL